MSNQSEQPKLEQYTHRPTCVDAIRVTKENFLELSTALYGSVIKNNTIDHRSYIRIQGDGQFNQVSIAFTGQWIVLDVSDEIPFEERCWEATVLNNDDFQELYVQNPIRGNNDV